MVQPPSPMPQKPPGEIMSKLMQSGFTQNWFFKNEDPELEEDSPGSSRKTSKAESLDSSRKTSKEESNNSILLDENASFETFGPQKQEFGPHGQNLGPKGFFGVL